jgi:hypothetical protein
LIGDTVPENPGEYPLNPTSDVGRFRVVIGDTQSKPFDPPTPGVQNYGMYSDLEIEGFLAQSSGSVEGAVYWSYLQMAGSAAREAKNVQDLDLRVNTEKRAEYLLSLAREWKDRWDEAVGAGDIFEVFDTGVGSGCGCVPEATPRPYCRKGCYGGKLF